MWRALLRNRTSMIGLALTFSLVIVAVLAPFIAPQDPLKQAIRDKLDPPSSTHLLGTDRFGRDILSRYQTPCLLCSEPTADQCHRRLVTEYWRDHMPDLTIVHL